MKKVQQEDFEIRWRKMERYWELSNKDWEIRKTLWNEFPDRMMESTKNIAEYCLRAGIIKCKHDA